jgi:isoleucyl-tRNA synthetase
VQHVGMDGRFKPEVTDFAGQEVKPRSDDDKVRLASDIAITKYLQEKGLFLAKKNIVHSYPHCWRCDTPLINYATSSWFVKVTAVKEKALELAKEINWSPEHIKEGRFGKWLEGARDWSISRQRFWASVMPIWKCENKGSCSNILVFGSAAELEKVSGQKVDDLHKHIVDAITFACEKCNGTMKRIPDVLDTWFDSGSMPYAQVHYPFENKEKFEGSFPAEFIAEGQDQTRAFQTNWLRAHANNRTKHASERYTP